MVLMVSHHSQPAWLVKAILGSMVERNAVPGFLPSTHGVSMNHLAEEMIGRELRVLAEGMEMDLAETVQLLRQYRAREPEQQAAEFARAEIQYDDPLRSHHVATPGGDPFGVEAAFGHAVER